MTRIHLNAESRLQREASAHLAKFFIGDNVQVIDPEEKPSEWATFVITHFDSGCYLLSGLDKSTYEPFWVTTYEICPITLNSER